MLFLSKIFSNNKRLPNVLFCQFIADCPIRKRSRKAKMPGFFVFKEIFAERQDRFRAGEIVSVFSNG